MKIVLSGHGRMGQFIEALAVDAKDEILGFVDERDPRRLEAMPEADVVIDFSHPDMLPYVESYVRRTGTALCSGTTGLTADALEHLASLGEVAPVLHSANYSLGVAVFRKILTQITPDLRTDFDIEIVETHHNKKADAPSGTAKLLADAIDPGHKMSRISGRDGMCGQRSKDEIGIFALRGGTAAGEHTVYFFGDDETLSITHSASSRRIFASGALKAARILAGRTPGLYTLDDIIFSNEK